MSSPAPAPVAVDPGFDLEAALGRVAHWLPTQGPVARLARGSRLPLLPFDTPGARALMALPARDALVGALAKTVGREDWCEPYLLETLLTQPGWSGLIGECECNPGLLLVPRAMTLLDCAAVTLVAELGCLERELGTTSRR
jgi:hypothetical protein